MGGAQREEKVASLTRLPSLTVLAPAAEDDGLIDRHHALSPVVVKRREEAARGFASWRREGLQQRRAANAKERAPIL